MSFKDKRREMIRVIKQEYGLESPEVLRIMSEIPRHKFVSRMNWSVAYNDRPVSIGHGQTMSQPYTVAFMTHLLIEKRDTRYEKILEIGTGSGYQAAVLSKLVDEVYSVEVVPALARKSRKKLKQLKYHNVQVKSGNGAEGWKKNAPYDAIMITAGVEEVPQELLDQLKRGGVLVAPIGKYDDKEMTRYQKLKNSKPPKLQVEEFGVFHFVPFVES